MAVTAETLRLLGGMRIQVGGTVDTATSDLIRAWAVGWTEVRAEWDAALADLVIAGTDGRWPTPAQLARADRAQRALDLTRARLVDLGQQAGVRVLQDLPQLTGAAAEWHARITATQLPGQAGTTAELTALFNRVDPAQLDAIVARTTQQITSLTLPLSVDAMASVQAELIRGVAIGDNPRRAATRMLARVEGAFNGGLNRALVIARTEMLDAHRQAGAEQDRANAAVLGGWTWAATLDSRTCPSCWAMHGSEYALDVPGPHDHQQGRCARLPRTKSWRELGFDLDEPPSLLPDSRQVFDALPAEDQLRIMGPQRLELLQTGQIGWRDMASRRVTAGWRDSFAPTPVRDLATVA